MSARIGKDTNDEQLLEESKIVTTPKLEALKQESEKLLRILGASLATAKGNS